MDSNDLPLRVAGVLLQVLADGKVHSRVALERVCSASAAQLDDAIALLTRFQVPMSAAGSSYSVPGGLELLSEETIRSAMGARVSALTSIDVQLLVDSTNVRLGAYAAHVGTRVCLAEAQSSGHGRGEKSWVSPMAANLYLSLRWRIVSGRQPPAMTSLAVGAAVARAIASHADVEIALKWPNDLVWRQRKLGGLLVEHRRIGTASVLIIGVGINVSMPHHDSVAIDQPWVDLSEACGHARVSRNTLAGLVIAELVHTMLELDTGDTGAWLQRWQCLDAVRGQQVRLRTSDGCSVDGVARGVDDSGALLLESGGLTRAYHAGEVSLRVVS